MPIFFELADRALGGRDPLTRLPINPAGPAKHEQATVHMRRLMDDEITSDEFFRLMDDRLGVKISCPKVAVLADRLLASKRDFEAAVQAHQPAATPDHQPLSTGRHPGEEDTDGEDHGRDAETQRKRVTWAPKLENIRHIDPREKATATPPEIGGSGQPSLPQGPEGSTRPCKRPRLLDVQLAI